MGYSKPHLRSIRERRCRFNKAAEQTQILGVGSEMGLCLDSGDLNPRDKRIAFYAMVFDATRQVSAPFRALVKGLFYGTTISGIEIKPP
jgi:hypothetical protein